MILINTVASQMFHNTAHRWLQQRHDGRTVRWQPDKPGALVARGETRRRYTRPGSNTGRICGMGMRPVLFFQARSRTLRASARQRRCCFRALIRCPLRASILLGFMVLLMEIHL